MNYGLARIIKEPLYQALRNTMYIIIGAFALTIYSMFVVNDKGAHSALAVGMLFSQCIIYWWICHSIIYDLLYLSEYFTCSFFWLHKKAGCGGGLYY